MSFEPQNPHFAERTRELFAQQSMMQLIGAQLIEVAPGRVSIEMAVVPAITQQHGFVHAGAVTSIVDSACGFAAFTLMPADSNVLSVEFKVNLLAPARGVRLVATGAVLKPGRTITVCRGDVYAFDNEERQTLCATMLATMIRR